MQEYCGKIGILRLKVIGLAGADKDAFIAAKKRWRGLAESMQRIANETWLTWIMEHRRIGSGLRLRQWMDALRTWHNTDHKKRGDKPKCPVQCLTSAMQKTVYRTVCDAAPEVNSRTKVLALNIHQKRIKGDKASEGAFSRWQRILTSGGEMPTFSHPEPIPFDKQNAKIVIPANDEDPWQIELRIDREERPGKSTGQSTVERLVLLSRGRSTAGMVAVLWKIVTKEAKFCGSNLVFRKSTGEWFAHICYRMTKSEKVEVDPEKRAYLSAGRTRLWRLRFAGDGQRPITLGGRDGYHIYHVRKQLLSQRLSYQEGYRHASSARKGHGRRRALAMLPKFTARWKDFVKTANQHVASAAVKWCVSKGYGTLVYVQPTGQLAEGRRVATVGKTEGRRDSTGWDFAQLKTLLAYKCAEFGVGFSLVQMPQGHSRKGVRKDQVEKAAV